VGCSVCKIFCCVLNRTNLENADWLFYVTALPLHLDSPYPWFQTKNDKVHSRTGRRGPEGEQRYSSTLSLTSALDVGEWSTPRPGRFIPAKETRYPLYRNLGGLQGYFGLARKISPPPGFDHRTVQAVRESL